MKATCKSRNVRGGALGSGLMLAAVVAAMVLLVILILRWREDTNFGADHLPPPNGGETPR